MHSNIKEKITTLAKIIIYMKKILLYVALSFHWVYSIDFNETEKQIFKREELSVLQRSLQEIEKVSVYIRSDSFSPSPERTISSYSRQLFIEINRILANGRANIARKSGSSHNGKFGKGRLNPPLSQWARDDVERSYILTGQIDCNFAESELIREFSEFIIAHINPGDESQEYRPSEFPSVTIRVVKNDLPEYDYSNIDAFKLSYKECQKALKKLINSTHERDISHLIYHRNYGAAQSFFEHTLSYCKQRQPDRNDFETVLFNYFFKKTALVVYINDPVSHSRATDYHNRMNRYFPKLEYCGCIYMCFPLKENGDLYYTIKSRSINKHDICKRRFSYCENLTLFSKT
ncbi:MAG: hypothetical protein C0440_05860 [Candidatus Pelagibacter sp.]|nr:hypothetical protein [Candidatus Pelagibacter sp.]